MFVWIDFLRTGSWDTRTNECRVFFEIKLVGHRVTSKRSEFPSYTEKIVKTMWVADTTLKNYIQIYCQHKFNMLITDKFPIVIFDITIIADARSDVNILIVDVGQFVFDIYNLYYCLFICKNTRTNIILYINIIFHHCEIVSIPLSRLVNNLSTQICSLS